MASWARVRQAVSPGLVQGFSRASRSREEGRIERGDKVVERVENCEGVCEGGEGDLYSCAKRRRPPRGGLRPEALKQKRQRARVFFAS
jgi:hypothetical protein